MDKNNRRLKILYKCSAIWQHICCTYHQLNYSSPNRSKEKKKRKKKEPHKIKRAYTFRKMVVQGKRSQENGP